MLGYIQGIPHTQDPRTYIFEESNSSLGASEQNTRVTRLSLPLLAKVISFLSPGEIGKLKEKGALRDAVSHAQLFQLFPKRYLERISSLFSSTAPICLENLMGARQNAARLSHCDDKRLSPVVTPPGKDLPPDLYSAYAGAYELLLKRDAILCSFFEAFLKSHEYPEPEFMRQNLEIADKAERIRQEMREKRYEFKMLQRGGREIPPEAVTLLQMSDEMCGQVEFTCRGFNFLPDLWRFEILFALIENNKLPAEEFKSVPFVVFEEAIRTHRNEVAKRYFLETKSEGHELISMARWSHLARKEGNEEILHLLQEEYRERFSQLSPGRRRCFSLNMACGFWNEEIYGDVEAGVSTRDKQFQFQRLEPLQWYGMEVPPLSVRHGQIESAIAELDMLKAAFAQESEYLERIAAPTPLFSSERPISLSDFNRYLDFAHRRAEVFPKDAIEVIEIPSAAELFPDLYCTYFRAIQELKKRDEALVQFFNDYLRLHRLPVPACMQEEDLGKKARLIREEIQNRTFSELSVSYGLGGGLCHITVRMWERDYRSTNYPPELAHFRMTHSTFYDALKHCYHNDYDETIFALIESGKLEYFSSLRFRAGWLSSAHVWLHVEFCKKMLFKAVKQKRIESVEILMRVLGKKINWFDLRICRKFASGQGQILKILKERGKLLYYLSKV